MQDDDLIVATACLDPTNRFNLIDSNRTILKVGCDERLLLKTIDHHLWDSIDLDCFEVDVTTVNSTVPHGAVVDVFDRKGVFELRFPIHPYNAETTENVVFARELFHETKGYSWLCVPLMRMLYARQRLLTLERAAR
ncbi:MAG: hypothetical protein DI537_44270 [Stutzerimonas stutzeri]|nr:MAG: hypothetical protein DI537_44270 [Stutzerimonas stutzeri]